jgi:uncharacterized protein
MMRRRALLIGGALAPTVAHAQSARTTKRGFYEGGQTKERPVRFSGHNGARLEGTLLLPLISELQYVPGVVLVAGSGPTDRNGNNPLVPVRIDVLKEIAELLGRSGIATLRYDKRGVSKSAPRPNGSLEAQEEFFIWDNFVGDVVAAHAELLRHNEIKPYATALLGHSEGGLLAIAAAKILGARKLYGLVLAATPGLPMADIVRLQVARATPHLREEIERTMTAILATGHVPAKLTPELQVLFPPYAGPFLRSALAYDGAKTLREVEVACLVLHGAADQQVVPMGAVQPLIDALGTRSVSGEAVVLPQVSHNLKLVSGPGDLGFNGPLAPAVATKLTEWLVPLLGA